MRGLIMDPGIVIVFHEPLRPLNPVERADRDRFLAANRAAGRVSPQPGTHAGAKVVARIDEDGRDRTPPLGKLRAS